MNTIGLELWVGKQRQDEDIGDAGLVENAVEGHQDGIIPSDIPKWHATKNGWLNEYLQYRTWDVYSGRLPDRDRRDIKLDRFSAG